MTLWPDQDQMLRMGIDRCGYQGRGPSPAKWHEHKNVSKDKSTSLLQDWTCYFKTATEHVPDLGRVDRLWYNERIAAFLDSHVTIVLNKTCSSGTESQQATLASKHKKTVCLHLHATRQEIVEYGCEMVWTWTELCQMCLAEIHTVVLTHGRCQDSW